ncbi:MAG TPA: hypothetical protein VL096_08830, partial [Pirellulaceae bacterium]|nr:hypothetical protein [Pirellulaceae bacterium]
MTAVSAADPPPLDYLQPGWVLPKTLDPQEKTARVLLLLPSRPLLIEFQLTIDEQPFRTLSEQRLERLHTAADTNRDGQ